MTACERCHRRKTRCDRLQPSCTTCAKSSVRCVYPEDAYYRQSQREHMRAMEQRIRDLERENDRLRTTETPSDQLNGQPQARAEETHQQPRLPEPQAPQPFTPSDGISRHQTERNCNRTSFSQSSAKDMATPTSRYLGTNAGVEFVDLVERVVDSPNPHGDLFARVTDAYCGPRTPEDSEISAPSLPNRAAASELIASYFGHWHLTFPLLYRPAFLKLADSVYEEPGFLEKNAHYPFVFNMVLALGSATSKRFEWSFKDTEMYFRKAMSHLDEILSYRDIRTLQALLLCCQYGIHASLRDNSSQSWDLLGKAERICVEIGLHQMKSTARLLKCDIHLTGDLADALQVEMQRRCFWCFYSLDRIVSITLARPLTPADEDIETPLPSPLDDDELTSPPSPAKTQSLSNLSPFLQLIHVRQILARIHRSFYTSVPTRSLPLEEKLALRRNFLLELETWRRNIPNLQLPSYQHSSSLSSFSYPAWYEALYHGAVLLMFRPSGAFRSEESQDLSGEDDVLKMMWESSRSVIKRYKEILQARRLNYSWICLYTIFMAGLANVYAVGRCSQRRKVDVNAFVPDWIEVLEDVRDCSNILTAICERWDDARSSCEIFGRLSSSALRELMKSEMVVQQQPANIYYPTDGVQMMPELQIGEVMGFQDLFQDMQSSLQGSGGPNEVVMGLDRAWFG